MGILSTIWSNPAYLLPWYPGTYYATTGTAPPATPSPVGEDVAPSLITIAIIGIAAYYFLK